jgi:hypothetical protein
MFGGPVEVRQSNGPLQGLASVGVECLSDIRMTTRFNTSQQFFLPCSRWGQRPVDRHTCFKPETLKVALGVTPETSASTGDKDQRGTAIARGRRN